jgi:hypothetical protein
LRSFVLKDQEQGRGLDMFSSCKSEYPREPGCKGLNPLF